MAYRRYTLEDQVSDALMDLMLAEAAEDIAQNAMISAIAAYEATFSATKAAEEEYTQLSEQLIPPYCPHL